MIKAILACAALAATALPALAQRVKAPRGEDLDAQLVRVIIEDLPDKTEVKVGKVEVTELAKGEDESFIFTIKPGASYSVYGACDLECSQLGLKVLDEKGLELDKAEGHDDAPVAIFRSDKSRELHLTLSMGACEEASCHAGVGVYEQR